MNGRLWSSDTCTKQAAARPSHGRTSIVAQLVARTGSTNLTGGYVPGQELRPFRGRAVELMAAVGAAEAALGALIDAFDDPGRCYLSQPHPGRAPRFSDYAQLARVAEWVAAGE